MQISGGGIQISGGVAISSWLPYYGSLYTWGQNTRGQLGNGSTATISSPATVSGGGTNWLQVSTNGDMGAGVKTDGTLWTWGSAGQGKLGNGTITSSRSSPGTTAGGGTTWLQVSAGYQGTAAVKTDGTLWTWGSGTNGQLGQNTGPSIDVSSPQTVAGGGNTWSQVAISTGYWAAAIKSDGTLWTWGNGANGRLGNNATADTSSPGTVAGGGTTWKQVALGNKMSAAVKTDGTLWVCGYQGTSQLGIGISSATSRTSFVTTAGGGTNWSSVSCGFTITAAIKSDGTLWTWGAGTNGGLGNGTTTEISSPSTVAGGGTNWSTVACGQLHMAAIKTDGSLWAWGQDPTAATSSSPVTVAGSGITTWRSVSTSGALDEMTFAIAAS